jgi:GTPase
MTELKAVARTRALIVHPSVKTKSHATALNGALERHRSADSRLEETVNLADAIALDIAEALVAPISEIRPSTYIGSGKVAEIGTLAEETGAELVIMDCALSPVQQRNLERAWKLKVIDRTGLILEIFGERAQTREGRLQVELAHLTYQKSRLVRSWTHLERQRGTRGGAGFLGGPGETQMEADRRMIDERIKSLKKQLETVVRTRQLQRKNRRRVPYSVVALVGYTNAGKSTLFNRLTHAHVFADNLLFATLDPTMRGVTLPSGRRIILSDTVGFISDLPTHLIAAFRATLEEVIEADIVLHVRDWSHPEARQQRRDVLDVLESLNVTERDHRIIEVLNKADLVPEFTGSGNLEGDGPFPTLKISALTGEGCDALLIKLDELLAADDKIIDIDLGHGEGAPLAWLYEHGEVLSRNDNDAGVRVSVRLADKARAQFEHRYPAKILP